MNQENKIIKSDLIEIIAKKQSHLSFNDVEYAVNCILEQMAESLAQGVRIEIRGFGAFSLHHRPGWVGRNPKTGERVPIPEKYVLHFKPGKILSDKVNTSLAE